MPWEKQYKKRGKEAQWRHSGAYFHGRTKLKELKSLKCVYPEVFKRILHVIGDGSQPQPDQRYPHKQVLTQSWAQSASGYGMLQKLLSSMHEALDQLQRPLTAEDDEVSADADEVSAEVDEVLQDLDEAAEWAPTGGAACSGAAPPGLDDDVPAGYYLKTFLGFNQELNHDGFHSPVAEPAGYYLKTFLGFNLLSNEDIEVIENRGTARRMQDGLDVDLGELKDVPAPDRTHHKRKVPFLRSHAAVRRV